MSNRQSYSYSEAIDDLDVFINKYVQDQKSKDELLEYLALCRTNKTVTFRYIHEEIMNYRKKFSDYRKFTVSEMKMIEDLMHFWG